MTKKELKITRQLYQLAIYIFGQISTVQELFDWRGEIMQEGVNEMWAHILEVSLEDIGTYKIDIMKMPARFTKEIADFLDIPGEHVMLLVHNQMIEQGRGPLAYNMPNKKVKIE